MSVSLQTRAETAETGSGTVKEKAIPACINPTRTGRGKNRMCCFFDTLCPYIPKGTEPLAADFSRCKYVCYSHEQIEPTMYRIWEDSTPPMSEEERRAWEGLSDREIAGVL